LADALKGVKAVEVAFVFGSLAGGTGTAASDVDLMVIGQSGLRVLVPHLRKAGERLGREINPVTMTPAEFAKARGRNGFLSDIMTKEKLFVKGGVHELERLG
jgi:predicted nucleotidyltransferase